MIFAGSQGKIVTLPLVYVFSCSNGGWIRDGHSGHLGRTV